MQPSDKIFIAGHRGMVGSAIKKRLQQEGFNNLVLQTSLELDLRDGHAVADFFKKEEPQYVFLSAARVGGIMANSDFRADFIYDNIMIQSNVIHASYKTGIQKLLFLGSSCIYPKMAAQPIREEYLMSGFLEATNEAYAVAKIAGIKMCQAYNYQYGCNFISVMPTNLYGSNDNYDLNSSHVLPALLRKFHEAKETDSNEVTVWGTGEPKREFLHADDLADACYFLMKTYNDSDLVNIGTGEDISIGELAKLIRDIVGFKGDIIFDHTKPNGTPRKLLDVSKLSALGWKSSILLREGIQFAYKDFLIKFNSHENSINHRNHGAGRSILGRTVA
jgi:GDP-L-fucose synthase